MSWSTPPTATVGEVWTAAKMNTIRDDLNALSTALLIPAHEAGLYYVSQFQQGSLAAVIAANQLYGVPISIPATRTYDRLGLQVTVTAGNVRMGIYADDNGRPGALLLDAGAAAVVATTTITISQSLAGPAKYWLASLFSGTPTVWTFNATAFIGSGTVPAGFGAFCGASRAFAYGALPDPFNAASGTTGAVPAVAIRAA